MIERIDNIGDVRGHLHFRIPLPLAQFVGADVYKRQPSTSLVAAKRGGTEIRCAWSSIKWATA